MAPPFRLISRLTVDGDIVTDANVVLGAVAPTAVTVPDAVAALIGATKHAGLTLAPHGILVNSIAPGSIAHEGGSWERFQNENPPDVVSDFIEQNLPMGRFGWPEPVGDVVAFLASERASLITGACIVVDGGQSHSMI